MASDPKRRGILAMLGMMVAHLKGQTSSSSGTGLFRAEPQPKPVTFYLDLLQVEAFQVEYRGEKITIPAAEIWEALNGK